MDTSHISSLIQIRDYLERSINNFSLSKKKINDIKSMLLLIDNKIVNMLVGEVDENGNVSSTDFKQYIDFENKKETAMLEAAINSNLKSVR